MEIISTGSSTTPLAQAAESPVRSWRSVGRRPVGFGVGRCVVYDRVAATGRGGPARLCDNRQPADADPLQGPARRREPR